MRGTLEEPRDQGGIDISRMVRDHNKLCLGRRALVSCAESQREEGHTDELKEVPPQTQKKFIHHSAPARVSYPGGRLRH